MNRRAQAVALLLLGAAVLQTSLNGGYLKFVKAGMQPLLIGAGVLLAATAAATVWYDWRNVADETHEGHGHGPLPRVGWLLLLPLFIFTVVAPQGLGADSAARSGSVAPEPVSDFDPLPPGDPASISLQEYASRAIFDKGQSMNGRTVRIIGFVLLGDDGSPYLARITVSCCAADGLPTKVGLTGNVPPGLAADTWLAVTGTYVDHTGEDPINGAVIAFIEVGDAEPIEQPASPYQF